jgi:hypothetical protein
MIKQIATLIFLFATLSFAQFNVYTVYDTTGTNDSIFIDLSYDPDVLQSDYDVGSEQRAIGFEMHGTWTNDSLQVYAATNPDSTYYPIYYDKALVYEVATTGNSYIALRPSVYAGIRYLMFKLPANEAENRLFGITRRQY